ncbi:unnamed protein product, partial [marine sediment metagenome]
HTVIQLIVSVMEPAILLMSRQILPGPLVMM